MLAGVPSPRFPPHPRSRPRSVPLTVVAREWLRIGLTGFGGPPTHIAMLRRLMVDGWGSMDAREFEDANAATGLLPGPSSTQMAIFCAYRASGRLGAIVGGLGFAVPAVVLVIALSMLFLAGAPPTWVRGAGAGAGAAVAAVAVHAARGFLGPSLTTAQTLGRGRVARWLLYVLLSGCVAALAGTLLVLVLLGAGLTELVVYRTFGGSARLSSLGPWGVAALRGAGVVAAGSFGSLLWVALKVGALSFGGGFVIIPLMQNDAVHVYHWMSGQHFLNAVALGQVTPGPVVATVAAVGYAAHGILGGVAAAVVAFLPSFTFVLVGGRRFERLRADARARAFLDGAGPAAIGAILGAAVTLAGALREAWQFGLLALAAVMLLLVRRGVVEVLVGAGLVGVVAALAGAPLPG
jgi:chromate transporter